MKKILITICACMDVISIAHADTETINWYVDNSIYDTTTCQTGGDIILPTPPTKRGYTFHGWISGIYDMSTLNTSVNGSAYYAHTASNICWARLTGTATQQACTLSDYSDLALREWKTQFGYGMVRGESVCSATPGETIGEKGEPDLSKPSNGGKYCWCHVTGFIPTGGTAIRKPTVSNWVFYDMYSSISQCTSNCSIYCGNQARYYPNFRASLYGSYAD